MRARELIQPIRPDLSSIARGIFCFLLAVFSGCDQPKTGKVPVPVLPDNIELCVVHIVNPRLPRMTGKQVDKQLSTAKSGIKRHCGWELPFNQPSEIDNQ